MNSEALQPLIACGLVLTYTCFACRYREHRRVPDGYGRQSASRRWVRAGLVVLALSLAPFAPAAAGPFEDAEAAYNRSDYATALRLWRPLAEQGDARAQSYLGSMYESQDVSPDYAEALKWYRLAADRGNAKGEAGLGFMYAAGQGLPQDYSEALKWFRKAAPAGNADAQFYLGWAYGKGKGVQQDDATAAQWYRLAADQGDARAQCQLGDAYEFGVGVPNDDAEAVKWYRLAAERGRRRSVRARRQLPRWQRRTARLSARDVLDRHGGATGGCLRSVYSRRYILARQRRRRGRCRGTDLVPEGGGSGTGKRAGAAGVHV
jgi:TPR repeat protein